MERLAEIRAAYPTPCTAQDSHTTDDPYCVGSALCRFYGIRTDNFPHEDTLAEDLTAINPDLRTEQEEEEDEMGDQAWQFAQAITEFNDERAFEDAWRLAGEALAYTRPRLG